MAEQRPTRWVLFCAMIDNFGDIGVCWRLARQLVHEHGIHVDLWVDDWSALQRFLSVQTPEPTIAVHHWQKEWLQPDEVNQQIAASQVIIEAFGCELPAAVKQQIAAMTQPPLWINLEYLSAEDWVAGCHGLPSPQNLSPAIRKYFFFPGFGERTGGLLREKDLLSRHQLWQQNQDLERQAFFQKWGLTLAPSTLMISLFSYENPALPGLLQAFAEADEPALCVVPQGRSLYSLALPAEQRQVGAVTQRGSLTLVVTAFSSQDDYDQLLSLCDLNIVRGEDSFVRAQWAAKPMLWHIYPQDDGVHLDKLNAFMNLYLEGLESTLADAMLQWARRWNQGEDCRDLWHYLRPQLTDLRVHALRWQQKLAEQPDLATNLVRFTHRPPASLTL